MNLNPSSGPPVAVLKQRQTIAAQATADAETAVDLAAHAVEAKPDDAKAAKDLAAAQRELEKCQAHEARLARAIKVSNQHQSDAERKAAAKERQRAREGTLKLAGQKPGAKVETAIALLVEGWGELEANRKAVRETCPIPLVDLGDLNGFLVRPESLAVAVQLHMRKAGLDFIFPGYPEPTHTMPTLCERLGRVDEILARKLEEDAADGAGV